MADVKSPGPRPFQPITVVFDDPTELAQLVRLIGATTGIALAPLYFSLSESLDEQEIDYNNVKADLRIAAQDFS